MRRWHLSLCWCAPYPLTFAARCLQNSHAARSSYVCLAAHQCVQVSRTFARQALVRTPAPCCISVDTRTDRALVGVRRDWKRAEDARFARRACTYTGLYDNLQKYDLPSPQSIFELSYFREKPDAFYRLCSELWPDNFAPTPTHHFLVELHARGLLRRCFTQNIDSLEALAHMPPDMIVAAHGNFDRCSCIEDGHEVPVDEVRAAISHGKEGERGWLAMAERHGGLVKPDIGKHITHALAHSCCRAICEPARPERPPPSGGRTGTGALVRG